jgi:hypothetical protein
MKKLRRKNNKAYHYYRWKELMKHEDFKDNAL